jgi:hypothetical protein
MRAPVKVRGARAKLVHLQGQYFSAQECSEQLPRNYPPYRPHYRSASDFPYRMREFEHKCHIYQQRRAWSVGLVA